MLIIEIIIGVTLVFGIFIGVTYYLLKRLKRVTLELKYEQAQTAYMSKALEREKELRESFALSQPDNEQKIQDRTIFADD